MTSVSRPRRHGRDTEGAEPGPGPEPGTEPAARRPLPPLSEDDHRAGSGAKVPPGRRAAEGGPDPRSRDAERGALVEQRDFLLASLDDLDRELEAGDIDDDDYRALRDDYTARAAAVVRALERHDTTPVHTPAAGPRRLRTLAVSAAVVVFAVVAGVVIADNFGQRTPGESVTSAGPTSNREKVSQAQQLEASGDAAEAIRLYDEVLDSDPENADALTYKGWLLVRAGSSEDSAQGTQLVVEGMALLDQAIAARPGFAPPHVFKAVALRNQGEAEAALAELDAVDPTQLSAFAGLVTNLRQELEAQVGTGSPAGGNGVTPTTTGAP